MGRQTIGGMVRGLSKLGRGRRGADFGELSRAALRFARGVERDDQEAGRSIRADEARARVGAEDDVFVAHARVGAGFGAVLTHSDPVAVAVTFDETDDA